MVWWTIFQNLHANVQTKFSWCMANLGMWDWPFISIHTLYKKFPYKRITLRKWCLNMLKQILYVLSWTNIHIITLYTERFSQLWNYINHFCFKGISSMHVTILMHAPKLMYWVYQGRGMYKTDKCNPIFLPFPVEWVRMTLRWSQIYINILFSRSVFPYKTNTHSLWCVWLNIAIEYLMYCVTFF